VTKENLNLITRAKRYLRSAKILLDDGDNDSSVSRSYYAMFFCTEALLLTKGLTYSSHKGVITGFNQYFIKTKIFDVKMSKTLNVAFNKRQLSDYEHKATISEEEATEILEQAGCFVDIVQKYLQKK